MKSHRINSSNRLGSSRWSSLYRGFRVGTIVRVSEGSGLASNRLARVVDWREVKTDGRGIPTNIDGAYRPIDRNTRKTETPIRYLDSEELDLMYNNRLDEEP
mgnify:CR=1 FL=1